MTAKIYDDLFETAPVELPDVKKVTYYSVSGVVRITYQRENELHTMSINMEQNIYKRRIEFI